MDRTPNATDADAVERTAGGYVPRKRGDVLALDMGDGLVLYNHESSLVHHLNVSASIVWNLCDGDASGAQLATEIAEEYGLDRDEVAAQVDEVIRELDALGLVENASEPEGPDARPDRT